MESNMQLISNVLIEFVPAVALGVLGALARVMNDRNKRTLSFMASEAFIATFLSIVMVLMFKNVNQINVFVKTGIIGISCYFSKEVLDVLKRFVMKVLSWRLQSIADGMTSSESDSEDDDDFDNDNNGSVSTQKQNVRIKNKTDISQVSVKNKKKNNTNTLKNDTGIKYKNIGDNTGLDVVTSGSYTQKNENDLGSNFDGNSPLHIANKKRTRKRMEAIQARIDADSKANK